MSYNYNEFFLLGLLFLLISSNFLRFSLAISGLVPGMYVFGDSLVDVGNNNYLTFSLAKANFPHYGLDFPTKKPTGRFCNGKNAVDLLGEKVGLQTPPPYMSMAFHLNKSYEQLRKGVNFASGGSGIMNETNRNMSVLPLTKQVDFFEEVHKVLNKQLGFYGISRHFSKSLFIFETGSNDIFSYATDLHNKSNSEQYMSFMANTFKEQVKRLYNLGARKFVIVGVGAIGCIPGIRRKMKEENCNEELNQLSLKFNEALKFVLRNLKLELDGINYSYFDGFAVMQNVIQKPTDFGFLEVKSACCGRGKLKAEIYCLPISSYCSNRSNHLFWDASHPTEAAHRLFVDYIFNGPLQYTFPLNVNNLIVV